MSKPTITEFLEARIAEDERQFELPDFVDEEGARGPGWGNRGDCPICGAYQFSGTESATNDAWWEHAENVHQYWKVRAECAAKRAIIKQHEAWPVLVEQEPSQLESAAEGLDSITYRMTREIAWLTTKEYIKRFGVEPPTAPMILTLAAVYSSHPDYQPDWAPDA